jgi:hypothetical protein
MKGKFEDFEVLFQTENLFEECILRDARIIIKMLFEHTVQKLDIKYLNIFFINQMPFFPCKVFISNF